MRDRLFAKTLPSLVGIRLNVIALLVFRQLISLLCKDCRKIRSSSSLLGSKLDVMFIQAHGIRLILHGDGTLTMQNIGAIKHQHQPIQGLIRNPSMLSKLS